MVAGQWPRGWERPRKAEAALVAAGYGRDIHHIEGGFTAWKEAGLPVEAER